MSEEDKKILDTVEKIMRTIKAIEDVENAMKERRGILNNKIKISDNLRADNIEIMLELPENKKVIVPKEYNLSILYEERNIRKLELRGKEIRMETEKNGVIDILLIPLTKPDVKDLLILASNPEILDITEKTLRKRGEKIREDIEKLKSIVTLVEMALKE